MTGRTWESSVLSEEFISIAGTTDVAPQLHKALEGSLAALRRSAEGELPAAVVQRMHYLGERKDGLADADREEYLALVTHWKFRTLENAEAAVAL